MSIRSALFLLFAVSCVALQYAAADDTPKNPCDDPIIPGTVSKYCDAIRFHYGYDKSTNTCVPFKYTGCKMGTENNFRTKEQCEETCVQSD